MRYPRLTIEHNHGMLILANATIDDDGFAVGTVLGGGVTNRLFHCTSYTTFKVGSTKSWPLYRRQPREVHLGFSQDDKWCESPTPGNYYVSCVFCG